MEQTLLLPCPNICQDKAPLFPRVALLGDAPVGSPDVPAPRRAVLADAFPAALSWACGAKLCSLFGKGPRVLGSGLLSAGELFPRL